MGPITNCSTSTSPWLWFLCISSVPQVRIKRVDRLCGLFRDIPWKQARLRVRIESTLHHHIHLGSCWGRWTTQDKAWRSRRSLSPTYSSRRQRYWDEALLLYDRQSHYGDDSQADRAPSDQSQRHRPCKPLGLWHPCARRRDPAESCFPRNYWGMWGDDHQLLIIKVPLPVVIVKELP